ncbi:MAG: AAA family ATPase [Sphingobium sp.]
MTRVIGHGAVRAEIAQAAASGRLHHGWILAGPPGIGKASLARDIALGLLAEQEALGPVDEGHPAARLFRAGTHPDYAELSRLEKDNGDLARNIAIDQVRGLARLLSSAPSMSRRRVILIDSADDLERNAANALLKNLEEPPKDVVFLLVSHAPARLLPTIRSRCRLLRLSALDDAQMEQALAQAMPDMPAEERSTLIRVGEGSPGKALSLSGLGVTEMLEALRRIAATGDADNRERLALAKALAPRTARARLEAFLVQAPAFIAGQARYRSGPALAQAIQSWEQARDLASGAILLSLDPSATVFELCSHVASLADQDSGTQI